jgi:hypothetical protein
MESSCSIKRGERGLERGFDEKKSKTQKRWKGVAV